MFQNEVIFSDSNKVNINSRKWFPSAVVLYEYSLQYFNSFHEGQLLSASSNG